MNIEWAKKQWELGVVEPDYIDFLKHDYISRILECKDQKAINALVAYAGFLNSLKIHPDNYPLFLDILEANNGAAIDVILDGYQPDQFLDCVVPNHFIIKVIFEFLDLHKKNEVYGKTLQVFIGLLAKVYRSAEEGYQLYKPSIANVNALGKYLDEEKDQDDPLNRLILNVLLYYSNLEKPHETDQNKFDIARQSSRIRSDFFDNSRSLLDSMTENMLQKTDKVVFGNPPEYFYGKKPS